MPARSCLSSTCSTGQVNFLWPKPRVKPTRSSGSPGVELLPGIRRGLPLESMIFWRKTNGLPPETASWSLGLPGSRRHDGLKGRRKSKHSNFRPDKHGRCRIPDRPDYEMG